MAFCDARPWPRRGIRVILMLMTQWIASLLLLATAVAGAPRADRDTAPRIVVLGDSLASGQGIGRSNAFPAILQQRLDAQGYDYQVINAGVSGDTTGRAVRRVRPTLDGNVRILVVELGANDGLRGVPVSQIKSNLRAIIEEAQQRRISVLLCGMEALPIHGWEYTVAFHKAYQELADEYRVPLVTNLLINLMTNPNLMQRDRVHPNEAGARAMAGFIWPYLEPLLSKAA